MNVRKRYVKFFIMLSLLAFSIGACTGINQENLRKVDNSKVKELRQNWKEYKVYKRNRARESFQPGPAAILYKVQNNKKILFDNQWVEIRTEEEMAKTRMIDHSIVAEILGKNQDLYGYLIYRSADGASIHLVDENTVRIGYFYRRTYRH